MVVIGLGEASEGEGEGEGEKRWIDDRHEIRRAGGGIVIVDQG